MIFEKKLSVIVPVYNVEKYISKCVSSLILSENKDIEFILVNDGSTDDSLNIICEYARKDSRIVVIDKDNGGCASARNAGLSIAKGEYIGFVDGDDFVDSTLFDKLIDKAYEKYALTGMYDYVYAGYSEYYEDSEETKDILNDKLSQPYISGTFEFNDVTRLIINTRVAIWRAIYKRSVLTENNIMFHEELKRFDDLPFRTEFLMVAKSAACVSEHLYFYRLGRKGQDISCRDDRLFVHFDIFRILDQFVKEHFENDEQAYSEMINILQIVKINTHGFGLSIIDDVWKKDYKKLAKKDISANRGYFSTVKLIFKYIGKKNLIWYTKMMLEK